MSREEHECNMCGRDFEGYIVPVRDNFVDIVDWQRRKDRFDHLCKWCNHMYFQQDLSGRRDLADEYAEVEVKTWEDPRKDVV